MFNKTSKTTTIVESNPISVEIKPFYYEEKVNEEGQNVIVTNNLVEVVERIPETTILKEYIKESTDITESSIETVELTVNDKYIDYTLVTKNVEGITQHEYLINTETKEVKEVNVQTITEQVPIVIPEKPQVTIVTVEDKEVKPIIV